VTDPYAPSIISLQHAVSAVQQWRPGVESAIDALTEAAVKDRERLTYWETWQKQVDQALDNFGETYLQNRRHIDQLREDLRKTNEASLKENMAWTLTDRMVTHMNDLLGMQQTQIRDLVRLVEKLDGRLSAHLKEVGYSE